MRQSAGGATSRPLGSGRWVREPTPGYIIIYLQTGMETEPSGTHELYARILGFQGADGARLEMWIRHGGRIFEDLSSSYNGNLRRQNLQLFQGWGFRDP